MNETPFMSRLIDWIELLSYWCFYSNFNDVVEGYTGLRIFENAVQHKFYSSIQFEPSKMTVDGKEFVASPAEIRDFDAALATLRRGEFTLAQTTFLDFIKRYPESGYRPSALFWLGNSQYALKAYREAIINFKSVVAIAPDHVRSPEAALSIANCQVELKDAKSARKTLEDLIKVYPQSEAASVANDRLSKLK